MPIRFACEHCESTLNASSRKAGQQVTCPKCRQKTLVPVVTRAAAAVAAPGATGEPRPASPAERQPVDTPSMPAKASGTTVSAPAPPPEPNEVAVRDESAYAPLGEPPPPPASDTPFEDTGVDEVMWVYEDEAGRQSAWGTYEEGDIDFDRVSLPRYVLYGQGVLLIGMAMVALTLGILIGRGTAPRIVERSGDPTPCYLTGTIHYTSSGGSSVPDHGAVVIVVPQDRRPADKAPIEGLRPEDPLPSADQPSLSRIKSIGGDYARADERGDFKVQVPDAGEYFLLVVSNHSRRRASDRLDPVHLAQMGRYFLPAPDLIGERKYRWRTESIKRDKEYRFTFE